MRFSLAFLMAALVLAGCAKEYGPQRLDFVNTSRYTSSNRTGLNPADTLASRVYAGNADSTDMNKPKLGRLIVTVQYQPRRNPFVYPTPLSSFNRDSIDKSSESFVYLDSTLVNRNGVYPDNFTFTNIFGVRTTTGSERWQYDLRNSKNEPTASRAVRLNMRRPDSTAVYNDYTFKLIIPAIGVPVAVRGKSSRRFLHLRAGLAVPAYTVVKAGAPGDAQMSAQRLTDLIILSDGLTLVSPDSPTLSTVTSPTQNPGLSPSRWPIVNRRATLIYLTGLSATAFASQTTDAAIQAVYTAAATAATTGKVVGPVQTGQVYAFRTDEITDTATPATPHRYGLLHVVGVPASTTAVTTAVLQLQVRMGK
jgi:hypothetical protein